MLEKKFLELSIKAKALQFGTFYLKSKRKSPYFFNSGLFNSGQLIYELAECYADKIIKSNINFDIIFGIAYKGIPLISMISYILYLKYNINSKISYNRKESKHHGEQGKIVGANITNKKIIIIDDIITSGISIKHAINDIKKQTNKIMAIYIALDREEYSENNDISAIQNINNKYKIPIFNIASLSKLIDFISNNNINKNILSNIKEYKETYGIIGQ